MLSCSAVGLERRDQFISWTAKQLAALSGVTVRTLHHYDEIGLLNPARTGANGNHYVERKEWLRLHLELGAFLNGADVQRHWKLHIKAISFTLFINRIIAS